MSNLTGEAIKKIRGRMTQKDFSDLLGYDNPQFISLIENGHSKLPIQCIQKLKKRGLNVKPLLKAVIKDFELEVKGQIK